VLTFVNDFVLETCQHRHLERLLVLEHAVFADSSFSRLDFIVLMERAKSGFIIASKNEHLLGYVVAVDEDGAGKIWSIAVSPEFRRKGIGESLLKSAVDRLAICRRIYLLVDPNNVAAISLYHKVSFTETGRIFEKYYRNGDNAVEMVRIQGRVGNQNPWRMNSRSNSFSS
jgi:ribosomal-protein-alanine N-acetyltransferase